MNREDLLKIGALPKTLHVPYGVFSEAKSWSGDKNEGRSESKRVGGDWGMDVDLGTDADVELVALAVYEYLKQVAHKAMAEDLHGVTEKPEAPKAEVPKTEGLVPAKTTEHDAGEKTIEIVKFVLLKRTDGRFELQLYPLIGSGPGRYVEIYYVADNDRMMKMLAPVDDGYNFLELPKEYTCEWIAHYTLSEKLTTKGNPYKDLVRLEAAH